MKDLLDAATGLDADAVEQRARQVLAEPLYWFPVRHHSPTAARATWSDPCAAGSASRP